MEAGDRPLARRLSSLPAWVRTRLGSLRVGRPGLAEYLATMLVVVAIAAIILYDNHRLRAWTPNVATSALSIAITVTVVGWIVRHEARARVRPRVERTLYWMGLGFRGFLSAIVIDYAGTHDATFEPIPATAREMIELWLAEQEHEDVARVRSEGERLPMLLAEAREYVRELEDHRARDLDVLEPDLIRAIDDFGWHTAQATQLLGMAEQGLLNDRADTERVALMTVMQGAQQLTSALERYAPSWMTILEQTRAAAVEHSRRSGERAHDD
jgi:hypothetical protein